jgi:hypothetical protein
MIKISSKSLPLPAPPLRQEEEYFNLIVMDSLLTDHRHTMVALMSRPIIILAQLDLLGYLNTMILQLHILVLANKISYPQIIDVHL